MSMGFDDDDPRGEQTRQALASDAYALKPGQRPNTNGFGPQPNGRGDPGIARFL